MVDVVGVVDASTVQVTGSVAVTSPSFVDATVGDVATLPISSDDVDVEGTDLTLSEWIDANATRRVSVFASDVDASGGLFTDVPLYESVDVPRAVLAGLTMLVVDGDDLGIWTITASGPCTAGAALVPGDVIASTSGRIAVAQTNDGSTVAGVLVSAVTTAIYALQATPRAATDLWLATAADNPGPVIYDHGDRRAHAIFTPGIGGNASATGVIQLTEGTWSVHPTHDLIAKDRPRIPDRAGLAFADGVRIMWRGKLGVLEGWHPHNGIGYMDVLCNQSIGDDGGLDSIEPGLKFEYTDPPLIRGFMDGTPAGSTDLASDEHQDYSDPLTVDQAISETHLLDYRFDGGERILDWYVPTPAGDTPDLSLPGEYVEDWSLLSTTTRTAPSGFYRSGLEWRLGDEPNALAFLKAWDLGTGDLEIDFDATEVTTAGWTDSAGNEWDTIVARVVEGPCLYVGQGTAAFQPVALNPGEGDWTLAWWAHHTDRIGTDGDGPGWELAPDAGGAVLTLTDTDDNSVDVPLGITDSDLHFLVVSVDRTADLATAMVDGELTATVDISSLGDVTGGDVVVLPDGHTLRYLSFQADALSVPELDDLYHDAVASFDPPSTGGGAVDSVNGQTGTVVLDATDVGAVADDDARLASIPTYVWATSDATRNNASEAAADAELTYTQAANTKTRIEAHVVLSGSTSADGVLGITAPTGAAVSLFIDYYGGAVSGSGENQRGGHISAAGSGGAVAVGVIGGAGLAYRITGTVQTAGTAGDVALYWGPNSNGTGTTRGALSHLIHTP